MSGQSFKILVQFGDVHDDELYLCEDINPLNLTAKDVVEHSSFGLYLPHDFNENIEWHRIQLYYEPHGQNSIYIPLNNVIFNEIPGEGTVHHFQIRISCERCGTISNIHSINIGQRLCPECYHEEFIEDDVFDTNEYEENDSDDESDSTEPHTPRDQRIEFCIPHDALPTFVKLEINAPRRTQIQ